MRYFKTPVQAAIAAVAASFALQGAAMAAPAAEAPAQGSAMSAPHQAAPGMHRHGHMRHHAQRAALWVPGYGPVGHSLVKSLKLTDAQSKLVADAQAAQKSAMKQRFELMKKERKDYRDGLKTGKLDPHAAVQQQDAAMQKGLAERQDVTKKWLAVWDSLDGTQQNQIVAYLKGRADGRKGHHQQFSHASHHGWHGRAASKAPAAQQAPATPAS